MTCNADTVLAVWLRATASSKPDVLSPLDGEEPLPSRNRTRRNCAAQSFSLAALLPCCGCGFSAAAGPARRFDLGLRRCG